jgi:hypothetical protein
MSSYASYCQRQAADCARRAKLASSSDIKAYHRRLGLQWVKLGEKARVAGGRTREVSITLRDAPAGTAAQQPAKSVAAEHPIRRACHNIALASTVLMICLWW